MPNIRITRVARAAAHSRLANEVTGFNAYLNSAIADAEVATPPGFRLPIDYGASSRNFFQADIAPEDFAQTTAFTWPMQCLFAMDAENQNMAKFHAFAGPVSLGLNTFITWPGSRALQEMEGICDAMEEAVFACFNSKAIAEWAMEHDTRLVYNGDLTFKRSRIQRTAENWRQDLFGRLVLEVFDDA